MGFARPRSPLHASSRSWSEAMNTLPVIWALTGPRIMGASPSEEGKWQLYEAPYQTKEACLDAEAQALNGERIHRSYTLNAFRLKPKSALDDVIPCTAAQQRAP